MVETHVPIAQRAIYFSVSTTSLCSPTFAVLRPHHLHQHLTPKELFCWFPITLPNHSSAFCSPKTFYLKLTVVQIDSPTTRMSGTSSVGQGSVYEAGDQRNEKREDRETAARYNEGVQHSHKPNDSSRLPYV